MKSRCIEDFQLIEKIGSGTYGVVYKARDKRSEEIVALKRIKHNYDIKRIKRITREIDIQKMLVHQNIVRLLSYFDDGDSTCLVLEFCPGGSISSLIDSNGRLPLPMNTVRRYFLDIVNGLKFMHSLCVIHRDMKPGNCLIDKDNHIKICDFGLATTITLLEAEGNTICGTLNFISPEVMGQQPIDQSSDIWSLGGILFTMVTGLPPFTSESKELTLYKVRSASFEIPDGTNEIVSDLIRKLLSSRRSERYTIQEILNHPFLTAGTTTVSHPGGFRCPFRGGTVDIMDNGDLLLDLEGHSTLVKISSQEVSIIEKSSNQISKVYPASRVPEKYRKRVERAKEIASEAMNKKPLVIWNTLTGKFVMTVDRTLALINGKKMVPVDQKDKKAMRSAMESIISAVENSGYSRFPVIVGKPL